MNESVSGLKKVTIKDVAAMAGVSITTVSHALNNNRHVSESTRNRIIKAVEELNYKPNIIAQSLKQSKTNTLGVIVPDITNPFFTAIVSAIESLANSRGYTVILNNYNDNGDLEKRSLDILLRKQVDGIILAPGTQNTEYIQKDLVQQIPLVLLDRDIPDCDTDKILLDNYKAARDAVEYLIQMGHGRIALIAGASRISSNTAREKGYLDALKRAGLPVRKDYIQKRQARISGGYEAARNLIGLNEKPTALFMASNTMTIGALKAIRETGMKCPEDLSVLSFGDFEWSSLFDPRLTCIHTPVLEMGKKAGELLLDRIETPHKDSTLVKLPCELIVRDSCRAL